MEAILLANGWNSEIRTHDPFHPKEVRYQAALCPKSRKNYSNADIKSKHLSAFSTGIFK